MTKTPGPSDFEKLSPHQDVSGDVYAVREFIVHPQKITGITFDQPIMPGVNVSQCINRLHERVPDDDCSCGWYAYDDVDMRFLDSQSLPGNVPVVRAVVKVSGKVIVCNNGLKAEKMEVVAIAASSDLHDAVHNQLPDVPLFASSDQMLEEFPVEEIDRNVDEPLDDVNERKFVVSAKRFVKSALDSCVFWAKETWNDKMRIASNLSFKVLILCCLAIPLVIFDLNSYQSLAALWFYILLSLMLSIPRGSIASIAIPLGVVIASFAVSNAVLPSEGELTDIEEAIYLCVAVNLILCLSLFTARVLEYALGFGKLDHRQKTSPAVLSRSYTTTFPPKTLNN